ncbi:MAG: hypothetical protein AAB409_00455, partial [Gemmatimonadota bacterium]
PEKVSPPFSYFHTFRNYLLLAAIAANTTVHPQRSVLQFLDCAGEIVAQVALSPSGIDLVKPIMVAGLLGRLQVPF